MRVLIGQFAQESNSFIEAPTELAAFEGKQLFRGERVLTGLLGTRATVAGFLMGLEGVAPLELVPTVAAWAPSGGPLSSDCFETLAEAIVAAAEPGLDGVLLALHGAMMTDAFDDADGELLARVRERVGPDVPVIATLDLHSNITPSMIEHADGLIGYDTYPHIDLYEVGERAAELLRRTWMTGRRPRTMMVKVPMILPAEGMGTADEPMRSLVGAAQQLRTRTGVCSTSVFAAQPWLDVSDIGFSVIAVVDDDTVVETTRESLMAIAGQAWDRREEFRAPLWDVDTAIDHALAAGVGPVVLSDSADATGAGSAGDSAYVIERLLAQAPQKLCITCVVAPHAVAAAVAAGVGNRVTTSVGAQIDQRWTQPVTIEAEVRALTSGHFRYLGGKSQGLEVSMGRSAVLKVGHVHILAMERPAETFDPGMYESVGLPPQRAAVVLVRSANQFYDAYRDLAGEALIVDAPGPSTARLERLPWRHVQRPIYPLDAATDVEITTEIGPRRPAWKPA